MFQGITDVPSSYPWTCPACKINIANPGGVSNHVGSDSHIRKATQQGYSGLLPDWVGEEPRRPRPSRSRRSARARQRPAKLREDHVSGSSHARTHSLADIQQPVPAPPAYRAHPDAQSHNIDVLALERSIQRGFAEHTGDVTSLDFKFWADYGGAVGHKPPGKCRCVPCNAMLTNDHTWAAHITGKKHVQKVTAEIKRLKALQQARATRASQHPYASPTRPSAPVIASPYAHRRSFPAHASSLPTTHPPAPLDHFLLHAAPTSTTSLSSASLTSPPHVPSLPPHHPAPTPALHVSPSNDSSPRSTKQRAARSRGMKRARVSSFPTYPAATQPPPALNHPPPPPLTRFSALPSQPASHPANPRHNSQWPMAPGTASYPLREAESSASSPPSSSSEAPPQRPYSANRRRGRRASSRLLQERKRRRRHRSRTRRKHPKRALPSLMSSQPYAPPAAQQSARPSEPSASLYPLTAMTQPMLSQPPPVSKESKRYLTASQVQQGGWSLAPTPLHHYEHGSMSGQQLQLPTPPSAHSAAPPLSFPPQAASSTSSSSSTHLSSACGAAALSASTSVASSSSSFSQLSPAGDSSPLL
jgi:hypothetical protein